MTRHRFPPTPMPPPEDTSADTRMMAWIGLLWVGSVIAFYVAWRLT